MYHPLARGHTLAAARQTLGAGYHRFDKQSRLAQPLRKFGSLAPPKLRCVGCSPQQTRGRAGARPYRLRFGRVYFSGRFFGSIFVKPVPFLSSRI